MWCDDIGKVGVAMDRNEPESGVVTNTPVVGYAIFCVHISVYVCHGVCVCDLLELTQTIKRKTQEKTLVVPNRKKYNEEKNRTKEYNHTNETPKTIHKHTNIPAHMKLKNTNRRT